MASSKDLVTGLAFEEIPYGKISEEEKQKIKNRYVTVIEYRG